MNSTHIQELLSKLGCQKIKHGNNGWVHATCCFAKWNHSGGHDNNPSFGIAVEVDGHSAYKCHGCHAQGDLLTLIRELGKKSGKTDYQIMSFVEKHDQITPEGMQRQMQRVQTPWITKTTNVAGIEMSSRPQQLALGDFVDDTISESEFEALYELPLDVRTYMTDPRIPFVERNENGYTPRGLTTQTLQRYEVRWNPATKRIITPIRDVKGRLVSLSGRAFYKWTKPKFLHSKNFPKQHYLYGEFQAAKGKIGLLMEGQFDVQMLDQNGYRSSVAQMGSTLGPVQVQKLTEFFKEVVYLRDGDKAGKDAEAKVKAALHGHTKVTAMEIPEDYDPDDLTSSECHSLLGDPQQYC